FSSSSHESPVRKPSFSSSSDSRNKPTYSSTTSSQSSILSSPTHVPIKNYGALSPDQSPTRFYGHSRTPLSPESSLRQIISGLPSIKSPSPSPFSQISSTRNPTSPTTLTSSTQEATNFTKYGRPSSPKSESSTLNADRSSAFPQPLGCIYSQSSSKTA
ncbi:unnamed protein product, partial [Lymnaea stagnalis]